MGRSKTALVPGLQGTKGLPITAGSGTILAQSTTFDAANVTDACFLTCAVAGTATVQPAGNSATKLITIGLVPGSAFPLLVSNVTAATATGIVGIWS